MKPTPFQRHFGHNVEVRSGSGPHAAQWYCVQCQKHVAWISRNHVNHIQGEKNGTRVFTNQH